MPEEMEEQTIRGECDWSTATFEGNRRRQHAEFRALPFREKLARIEQMGEIAAFFAARRASRALRPRDPEH